VGGREQAVLAGKVGDSSDVSLGEGNGVGGSDQGPSGVGRGDKDVSATEEGGEELGGIPIVASLHEVVEATTAIFVCEEAHRLQHGPQQADSSSC
jgi:hypothetical protein